MKRIIIYLFFALLSFQVMAQSSPTLELRIPNATTAIGQDLPVGSKIYNIDTKEYWKVTNVNGVLGTATLTSAAASLEPVDTNTTYSAGSGLTLTGTVFSNSAQNATHTGDVTGSTALTIGADKVLDTHINWGTGTNQVSTTDMPEGTNLYYTEGRVSANSAVAANTLKVSNVTTNLSVSGTTSPLTLNSSDGTDVTITGGTGIGLTGTSGNITVTNTSPNVVQNISTTGAAGNISISGGSTLSLNVNDADASITNELQNLSLGTKSGTVQPVNISSGTGISIDVADNDNSSTNELQTISKTGSTVTLSNSGGSFTDDNTTYSAGSGIALTGTVFSNSSPNVVQDLSLSGNTVSLSGDATPIDISTATAVAANTAKVSNATHTGDVTGSTALTISANAVTNAKSAQMATKTYKGRTSSETGNPEDVAVSTMRTDLSINNVDNTSDISKPVSTLQASAIALKQNALNGTGLVRMTGTVPSYDNTSYLPLSGGIMTGDLEISSGSPAPLKLTRSSQLGIFFNNTSAPRYLGTNGGELFWGTELNHGNNYKVYHSGNSNLSTVDWATKQLTATGLQVNGSANFTGTVTAPAIKLTTGATDGYVLKSDAVGNATWTLLAASQVFKGTWEAHTNTPTLVNGIGTAGWYYRVTTAGTVNFGSGNITFFMGDDVSYNGTVWQRIPAATIAGNPLTRTNDTNVTLTLTGSPNTALLNATGITVGWTGTLADARIASSTNWNTAYTLSHTLRTESFQEFATGTTGQNNVLTYAPKTQTGVTCEMNGQQLIYGTQFSVTLATKIVKVLIPVYKYDQLRITYTH